MALTNDQITAQNFKEFYGQIRPYLNGAAHSGFTPVGVVISVMGKTAPLNYLVCDGTVYNIADYPELAAYFARQFDVCNFFGGDGVTTFAVPDLRGEFLRGSGTNSHANQGNGGAVGEHQDGSAFPFMRVDKDNNFISVACGDIDSYPTNFDKAYSSKTGRFILDKGLNTSLDSSLYSIRPTNTSILYCIATKNIFMDAGCNYSIDELVVGTWIDGKPVYQKTFTTTATYTFTNSWQDTSVTPEVGTLNIDLIIEATLLRIKNKEVVNCTRVAVDNNKLYLQSAITFGVESGSKIILKYTKTTD